MAADESGAVIRGRSPWYLAWRRLRRNYVAFACLALFVLIVVVCALAPVYARHVAHTGPNNTHVLDQITVNGQRIDVVSKGGVLNGKLVASTPVGPEWFAAGGRYVLGADTLGRDIAVRLLYGGRTSLIVGIVSSLICVVVAGILALLAGFYGGWLDFVITRFFDLFYAFPVILLGIALGAALAINGIHWGPIKLNSGNILIPTLVISYVLIPYVGRPLRGQVLSLRQKEFVEAAIAQGANPLRIMFGELLPNVASSILVFFTLIIANNIVLEAALSFLGAGVQPPTASWGTLISDGQTLIVTRPWFAIMPGLAIVLTVLALNVFGDGLRDALDPRAKVKIEH
ncbi:MAG: ABC transporter permease [Actinobacteria bacterium]|nr:MAG: ABC transporter permease [Actinomycetota bacterium]